MIARDALFKMAEESRQTPEDYVVTMILRRAFGHLKDLGDDRGSYRLYEKELPAGLRVEAAEIRG